MKRVSDLRWAALADSYPSAVERYRMRLANHDPFLEVAPQQAEDRALLDVLTGEGYLATQSRQVCPACRTVVEDMERGEKRCRCGFSFEHEEPVDQLIYFRPGRRARDARWLVTIHGMNTHGPWQEDFSWKLAQIYGYAIPVGIYKYGKILISPFLLLSQEHYARRLTSRLKALRTEMQVGGYGDRPDVIAHSFGTWLLARALRLDPELRLGRVVLTGSIVPPDFAWGSLLTGDQPRVEALLCHYGGRDCVVPLAQFFVPSSGPSGRRGFDAGAKTRERLCHRFEPTFGHSSYFGSDNLNRVAREVWGPFLTLPDSELKGWSDPPERRISPPWHRSRFAALTHVFKYAALTLLAATLVAATIALVLGLPALFRLVLGGP